MSQLFILKTVPAFQYNILEQFLAPARSVITGTDFSDASTGQVVGLPATFHATIFLPPALYVFPNIFEMPGCIKTKYSTQHNQDLGHMCTKFCVYQMSR